MLMVIISNNQSCHINRPFVLALNLSKLRSCDDSKKKKKMKL